MKMIGKQTNYNAKFIYSSHDLFQRKLEGFDYFCTSYKVEATSNPEKAPLAYHGGRYFILNTNVVKPSQEERERIRKDVEKHKR